MKKSFLSLGSLLTYFALGLAGVMLSMPSFAALAPVESRNSNSSGSSSNSAYGNDSGAYQGNSESIVPPPTVFVGRSNIPASGNKSANDPSATSSTSRNVNANSNPSSNVNANVNANANTNSATKVKALTTATTGTTGRPMTAQDRAAHLTLSQIENLQREVGELRGLVETQEHTIKQLKKSQQDLYLDLERRINQLQNAKAGTTTATPTASSTASTGVSTVASTAISTAGSTAASSASSASKASAADKKINKTDKTNDKANKLSNTAPDQKPGTDLKPAVDLKASKDQKSSKEKAAERTVEKATEKTANPTLPDAIKPNLQAKSSGDQEAYQQAYGFVRTKQYPEAVSALQDYLNRFKKGEQAPQAHYWLGEVYMVQWQSDKNNAALLDKAEHEFNSITSEYPNHPKTADALLKLGLIEIDRGNPDSATHYLSEVKTRYPGTAAARIAENKLQQLAAD